MQSIAGLVKSLATARLRLGDRELEARALRASETALILSLWPRPLPPMVKDPKKGTLAPEVPDDRDPAYLAARRAWHGQVACVEVAAAFGLECQGKVWDRGGARPEAELKEWGAAVAREMQETLTATQIDRAAAAVHELIDAGRVREAVIVEIPEGEAGSRAPEAFKLPKRYGIPDGGVFLRVCERYKIDPFLGAGVEHDDPGMWAMLLEQERVRRLEEEQAQPGE